MKKDNTFSAFMLNCPIRLARGARSGRLGTLLSHRPLRTVRDSFPSYSSSIPKADLVEAARWQGKLYCQLRDTCNDSFNRFRLMDAPSRCYPDVICFSISKDYQCFFAMEHQPDVCPLSGRANFEPVSTPLQVGIRFFRSLAPASPTVCLTVHLPIPKVGQGYEVG